MLLGVLVCFALVDYSLGWMVDAVRPDHDGAVVAPSTPSTGRGSDPRAASPAMARYPWARQHFASLASVPIGYWAFTERKPGTFDSPGLHVDGWERASNSSSSRSAGPRPGVWLFGGSMAFGVGQRDQHTIASELTRLADEAGLPIAVSNFGRVESVHYEEAVEYEQLLAERPDPAFTLFLDGVAEVQAQAQFSDPTPAMVHSQDDAVAIFGGRISTEVRKPDALDLRSAMWAGYRKHSLLAKGLRSTGLAAIRADAQAEPLSPEVAALGAPLVGRNAAKVYERARFLTATLSRLHDVEPLYFWQPTGLDFQAVRAARAAIPSDTIDLGDALDQHPEVYIDRVDVNEVGARLVAVAMWKRLEPQVAAWHRAHGG